MHKRDLDRLRDKAELVIGNHIARFGLQIESEERKHSVAVGDDGAKNAAT